jgi:hypothetical protein
MNNSIGKFWSANLQLEIVNFTWAIVTIESIYTLASPNITARTMIATRKVIMTSSYEKMLKEKCLFWNELNMSLSIF